MKIFRNVAGFTVIVLLLAGSALAADDGTPVDRSQYANRQMLPDFTATPCPNSPRSLAQINGNLYRHTSGGSAGLVLITSEGAVVIDPARTCTAPWLRDEIKNRFHVPVKYVINTHAHADHGSGTLVFQEDGALIAAHKKALEPIIGEQLAMAVPDRIFDNDMKITLGGETVLLHYVTSSHSNSMIMILFPKYKALQCTDLCGKRSLPFNDFPDFYYDGWIETLDWIVQQDANLFDDGHGNELSSKEDVKWNREYMINLHQQVLDLLRKGMSWDQLYREVQFSDEAKKAPNYQQAHILNILGMYRWVSEHRRGEW